MTLATERKDALETVLAEPGAFARWLDEQPDEAGVGWPGNACDCPLARYLASLGYKQPAVDEKSVTVEAARYRRDGVFLKPWASRFVETVDGGPFGREITAAQARQALRQALEECDEHVG